MQADLKSNQQKKWKVKEWTKWNSACIESMDEKFKAREIARRAAHVILGNQNKIRAAMKENKQSMCVEGHWKVKNHTQIKSGCRGKLLSIYESNQKKEIKTK